MGYTTTEIRLPDHLAHLYDGIARDAGVSREAWYMRVIWTRPARSARDHAIAARIEDDDAATRLWQQFTAAAERLGRFPNLGRVGRQPGTREVVVGGTPYILIYRIDVARVEILDVRHSAREPT